MTYPWINIKQHIESQSVLFDISPNEGSLGHTWIQQQLDDGMARTIRSAQDF